VVIVGLPLLSTESDFGVATSFFASVGVETAVIRSVHRLSSSKKTNVPSNSNMLLVTLDTGRHEVLNKCRRHNLKGKFEKAFAREDRTPGEQAEFNTMRAEMKKKNDELNRAGLLDNPCRYVIHKRERRPVCIDIRESGLQKRYVFKKPTATQLRCGVVDCVHRRELGGHTTSECVNNEVSRSGSERFVCDVNCTGNGGQKEREHGGDDDCHFEKDCRDLSETSMDSLETRFLAFKNS
jgi:hypothetical protein